MGPRLEGGNVCDEVALHLAVDTDLEARDVLAGQVPGSQLFYLETPLFYDFPPRCVFVDLVALQPTSRHQLLPR